MHFRAILIAFAFSATGIAQAHSADTPESVVVAFCAARNSSDQSGYDPLLTPSLRQLIAAAWAKNEEFEKKNPGDKPPLGDGVQFQAYSDWSPVCRAGAVGAGSVHVEHVFPDTESSDWTDRLVLKAEGDRLLVDDVLYGPEQFNVGLRSVLSSIISGKF